MGWFLKDAKEKAADEAKKKKKRDAETGTAAAIKKRIQETKDALKYE